jgi:hypothetical protein
MIDRAPTDGPYSFVRSTKQYKTILYSHCDARVTLFCQYIASVVEDNEFSAGRIRGIDHAPNTNLLGAVAIWRAMTAVDNEPAVQLARMQAVRSTYSGCTVSQTTRTDR